MTRKPEPKPITPAQRARALIEGGLEWEEASEPPPCASRAIYPALLARLADRPLADPADPADGWVSADLGDYHTANYVAQCLRQNAARERKRRAEASDRGRSPQARWSIQAHVRGSRIWARRVPFDPHEEI